MENNVGMTQSILDLDHLKRFTGGDAAVEAEILAIFIEQADMWLKLLEVDVESDAYRSAAHTIKGAARGVGAHALGDVAEIAEKLGDDASKVARSVAAGDVREAAFAAMDAARVALRLRQRLA
jgi:HPt (histidine-containing phosphotransfer) domain-containing protein